MPREALRVAVAAEALPGEALEHRRQLAGTRAPCASARTVSTNRIRIAKTATPTIRVPFSRSNEKAERIASRISVPATSASPSASAEQDQDVAVAKRAPAPDRERADQRAPARGRRRAARSARAGRVRRWHSASRAQQDRAARASTLVRYRSRDAHPDPGRRRVPRAGPPRCGSRRGATTSRSSTTSPAAAGTPRTRPTR